jgi:hypothetical protein
VPAVLVVHLTAGVVRLMGNIGAESLRSKQEEPLAGGIKKALLFLSGSMHGWRREVFMLEKEGCTCGTVRQ